MRVGVSAEIGRTLADETAGVVEPRVPRRETAAVLLVERLVVNHLLHVVHHADDFPAHHGEEPLEVLPALGFRCGEYTCERRQRLERGEGLVAELLVVLRGHPLVVVLREVVVKRRHELAVLRSEGGEGVHRVLEREMILLIGRRRIRREDLLRTVGYRLYVGVRADAEEPADGRGDRRTVGHSAGEERRDGEDARDRGTDLVVVLLGRQIGERVVDGPLHLPYLTLEPFRVGTRGFPGKRLVVEVAGCRIGRSLRGSGSRLRSRGLRRLGDVLALLDTLGLLYGLGLGLDVLFGIGHPLCETGVIGIWFLLYGGGKFLLQRLELLAGLVELGTEGDDRTRAGAFGGTALGERRVPRREIRRPSVQSGVAEDGLDEILELLGVLASRLLGETADEGEHLGVVLRERRGFLAFGESLLHPVSQGVPELGRLHSRRTEVTEERILAATGHDLDETLEAGGGRVLHLVDGEPAAAEDDVRKGDHRDVLRSPAHGVHETAPRSGLPETGAAIGGIALELTDAHVLDEHDERVHGDGLVGDALEELVVQRLHRVGLGIATGVARLVDESVGHETGTLEELVCDGTVDSVGVLRHAAVLAEQDALVREHGLAEDVVDESGVVRDVRVVLEIEKHVRVETADRGDERRHAEVRGGDGRVGILEDSALLLAFGDGRDREVPRREELVLGDDVAVGSVGPAVDGLVHLLVVTHYALDVRFRNAGRDVVLADDTGVEFLAGGACVADPAVRLGDFGNADPVCGTRVVFADGLAVFRLRAELRVDVRLGAGLPHREKDIGDIAELLDEKGGAAGRETTGMTEADRLFPRRIAVPEIGEFLLHLRFGPGMSALILRLSGGVGLGDDPLEPTLDGADTDGLEGLALLGGIGVRVRLRALADPHAGRRVLQHDDLAGEIDDLGVLGGNGLRGELGESESPRAGETVERGLLLLRDFRSGRHRLVELGDRLDVAHRDGLPGHDGRERRRAIEFVDLERLGERRLLEGRPEKRVLEERAVDRDVHERLSELVRALLVVLREVTVVDDLEREPGDAVLDGLHLTGHSPRELVHRGDSRAVHRLLLSFREPVLTGEVRDCDVPHLALLEELDVVGGEP